VGIPGGCLPPGKEGAKPEKMVQDVMKEYLLLGVCPARGYCGQQEGSTQFKTRRKA
jgi:hypothetical protein